MTENAPQDEHHGTAPETAADREAVPNTPAPARGSEPPPNALPQATLVPERQMSWAWLIPLLAVLLAAWLGYSAWRHRGVTISVQLPDGHGLRIGDDVRYRGITVGEIRDVQLTADMRGVVVEAALRGRADRLARDGTRFWVVRPQLGLTRVEGIETLIGPRYLAVLPDGSADRPRRRFVGLPQPPVVESIEPGDLEIILEASRQGSLRPGAPVTYRQVRIGTVLSTGLASDGSIVEARVHIRKAYRELVRRATRFWDSGGVRADMGLTGMSIELASLETLLAGGVELATPPPERAGEGVHTGHRFTLHHRPDDDWLEWRPTVALGSSLLPPGSVLPHPLRAAIGWKQGFIFKSTRSRQGWVLQTDDGLLGPADLLKPGEKAEKESVMLEVAGQVMPLDRKPIWEAAGLARLDVRVSELLWPAFRIRHPQQPEDCIALADPAVSPIPLAASRLTAAPTGDARAAPPDPADLISPAAQHWLVDGALPIDQSWHGACVLSRADGRLIGILLVAEDRITVAPLPQ